MISFESDYICGAHPEVMKRLQETNLECLSGYGTDHYCDSAKEKIRKACGCEQAEVEFLTGGTQTNAVVVATMLKDYEGVVAAKTGHVNVHEAGAIEYTGHKVLTVEPENGKVLPSRLLSFLEAFYADETHEHMVYPGMLYISHPTEYGTLYKKAELEELAQICHQYHMTLYLDGARLGYGLMSRETDVTLEDIARICDVFYIGGTKVGALCGEAVVFTKKNRPPHFINSVKKRGALLAKGRLTGIQFDALFTDDLYFRIGSYAIDMADKIRKLFTDRGYQFLLESPTNQQFVILENGEMERLKEQVAFSFWEPVDEDHTAVRFATSWSTTPEDLKELERILDEVK